MSEPHDTGSGDSVESAFGVHRHTEPALKLVLGTPIGANATELRNHGYGRTERACPLTGCPGFCYQSRTETVCGTCALVVDDPGRFNPVRINSGPPPQWRYFFENREYYRNGTTRAVGGYPHVHEWGDATDDPMTFYEPTR